MLLKRKPYKKNGKILLEHTRNLPDIYVLRQACRFAFCEKTQADKNSRKSKLKQIVTKLKFSEKFVIWDK